jgi:SCO1/SenC
MRRKDSRFLCASTTIFQQSVPGTLPRAAEAMHTIAAARTRPSGPQQHAWSHTCATTAGVYRRSQVSLGRLRHLAELTHGKITLLTFFYTSCSDPLGCPFGYVTLTLLRARLIADASLAREVRFVNVSLDPLNDTPAAIRQYAGRLGPIRAWSGRF